MNVLEILNRGGKARERRCTASAAAAAAAIAARGGTRP